MLAAPVSYAMHLADASRTLPGLLVRLCLYAQSDSRLRRSVLHYTKGLEIEETGITDYRSYYELQQMPTTLRIA